MQRIYKNTDFNFPLKPLLEVDESKTLTIRFFTINENHYIEKTNADIVDNHILLDAEDMEVFEEGVLSVLYTVSISSDTLSDDSYDIEYKTNTEYYIANGNVEVPEDDIAYIRDYLTDYYNKEDVDEIIASIDHTQYATVVDLHKLSGEVADNEVVTAAALTDLHDTKADKTEIPSLEGYATEEWVTDEIDKIDVTDQLGNYYTKDEVDDALENVDIDLTGFCYKQILTQAEYDALTEKDPQTIYIISDAPDSGGGTVDVDLTNYYTKEEVDTAIANVDVDCDNCVRPQGITQAEYEALATKENNVMYIITDVQDEWIGTQAEYDALPTKNDLTTYYIIQE